MLSTKELQKELNLSGVTLWRLRKEGMPHVKVGYRTVRYDLEEVLKWLETR